MSFDFSIQLGSEVPIYKQLVDQVRHGIAVGMLKEGDALPSIRSLSARLIVNHNTVVKAYQMLIQDGLVRSEKGKGLFIAPPRNIFSKEELKRRFDDSLDRFVSDIVHLGFSRQQVIEELKKRLADVAIMKD